MWEIIKETNDKYQHMYDLSRLDTFVTRIDLDQVILVYDLQTLCMTCKPCTY